MHWTVCWLCYHLLNVCVSLRLFCFKFSDVITRSRLYSGFSHSPWLPSSGRTGASASAACVLSSALIPQQYIPLTNASHHVMLEVLPLMMTDSDWGHSCFLNLILMVNFEKQWSGFEKKKRNCAVCACLCVCALSHFHQPSLSPSCSYEPSCSASALTWIHSLLCSCSSLNDAVTAATLFSFLIWILTLCLSFSLALHFTHSFWPCLSDFLAVLPPSLPPIPVSQRRSWIWTRASGRTSMSSQELWNFSFASFLSPWCPTASSRTSWRQSVSDQFHYHSLCLTRSPLLQWHLSLITLRQKWKHFCCLITAYRVCLKLKQNHS